MARQVRPNNSFKPNGASRVGLIQALGPMIRVLRWIAVIPACILAWYAAALFAGIYVLGVVDSFCPPELVVSGMCTASWYPAAERTVICFGVGLSALFVIVTAAAVSPTHKIFVSRLALGVGCVVAGIMGVMASAYLELIAAILAGICALFLVTWWLRRPRLVPSNVA